MRVDSGQHVGMGHMYRCIHLAKAMELRGFKVSFACRSHKDNINNLVSKNNFCLFEREPDHFYLDKNVEPANWTGGSAESEVDFIRDSIKKMGQVDILLFDHYGIDYRVEESFSDHKRFVIDDLAKVDHQCEYVLNQNYYAKFLDYTKKINNYDQCQFFFGPEYAILNQDFFNLRDLQFDPIKQINTVSSFFGGYDVTGESKKVIQAFISSKISDQVHLNIILSKNHRDFQKVSDLANSASNISVLNFVEHMARLIKGSDVFLGACGTSTYERAVLGVPSVCAIVADNQVENALLMAKNSLIKLLGSREVGSTTVDSWLDFFDDIDLSQLNENARTFFRLLKQNSSYLSNL